MIRFFNNISLVERNSFHIDARAARIAEFTKADELIDIFIKESPEEWLVLGGGNNILFTQNYQGLIISPKSTKINIEKKGGKWCMVRVDAGVEWDDFVEWTIEKGLWGAENLSLIPGKAGAAPVQNIGAYGVEIKDIIEEVEIFDTETLSCYTLLNEDCEFGYRESIFKGELKGRVIVTSILVKLHRQPQPKLDYADVRVRVEAKADGVTLRNIRDVICEIRRSKLPDTEVLGNAGSFFKNPIIDKDLCDKLLETYPTMPYYPIENKETEDIDTKKRETEKRETEKIETEKIKTEELEEENPSIKDIEKKTPPKKVKLAAGWLIDQTGMKGHKQGRVGVHEAQALVLVNFGGASGEEVLELAQNVQHKVKEKFGVEISAEVNII